MTLPLLLLRRLPSTTTSPPPPPPLLLLLLLLAPAALVQPTAAQCLDSGTLATNVAAFLSTAGGLGNQYGSVAGTFSFYDTSLCANAASCYFQNPDTPYGFLHVPDNPSQPTLTYQLPLLSPQSSFRMLSSEAIVIVGCTPPDSRYYSFTPYITNHYNANSQKAPDQLNWVQIFGSMSDSLNEANIQTFPNTSPFSSNVIIVITASSDTFTDLKTALASAFSISTSQVNVLKLPARPLAQAQWPGLSMGLDLHNDYVSFLFRQNFPTSATDFANWKNSNPFTVLRVFPTVTVSTPTLYSYPSLKPRLTSSTEQGYQGAFNAFVSTTSARLAGRYRVLTVPYTANLLGAATVDWGGICYLGLVNCNGDTRDASYMPTNYTVMFSDPYEKFIVLGANSKNNGLATYSSISIYNYAKAVGLTDIADSLYFGSADTLVPNFATLTRDTSASTPQPQFFQWTFARTCPPSDAFCTVVASSGYPSIAANGLGTFVARVYLASATNAAPQITTSLITPVALRLIDRCKPQSCDGTSSCGAVSGLALYDIAFGSQNTDQSSTSGALVSSNAVSGNTLTTDPNAVTLPGYQPYWDIDLTFVKYVDNVVIRTKGVPHTMYVLVSSKPFTATDLATARTQASSVFVMSTPQQKISVNTSFQYMRVQLLTFGTLSLANVHVNAYCSIT